LNHHVRNAEWWSRVLPNQLHAWLSTGYHREDGSERIQLDNHQVHHPFCIRIIDGPCGVFFGWQNAGESGRVLFIIGTMIEVGFDIYDWLEQFLIAFCHSSFKS